MLQSSLRQRAAGSGNRPQNGRCLRAEAEDDAQLACRRPPNAGRLLKASRIWIVRPRQAQLNPRGRDETRVQASGLASALWLRWRVHDRLTPGGPLGMLLCIQQARQVEMGPVTSNSGWKCVVRLSSSSPWPSLLCPLLRPRPLRVRSSGSMACRPQAPSAPAGSAGQDDATQRAIRARWADHCEPFRSILSQPRAAGFGHAASVRQPRGRWPEPFGCRASGERKDLMRWTWGVGDAGAVERAAGPCSALADCR